MYLTIMSVLLGWLKGDMTNPYNQQRANNILALLLG